MSTKKRFFSKVTEVGKKSLKPREKKKPSPVSKTLPKEAKPQQPQKKQDFPKNPRFITDRISKFRFTTNMLIITTIVAMLTAIVVWQVARIAGSAQKLNNVLQKRTQIEAELQSWQHIAQKYPDYRDAYYQIALLDYQLGDREAEKTNIAKVLQLDPYFQPAQNLEKLVN